MKKFIFTAICGVTVFIMLLTTAYGSVEPCNVSNDEDIIYTTDPLDAMLAKIEMENSNIITIKGEEIVEETDEGIIRHCPVKLINNETCAVKDTVFVINEKY